MKKVVGNPIRSVMMKDSCDGGKKRKKIFWEKYMLTTIVNDHHEWKQRQQKLSETEKSFDQQTDRLGGRSLGSSPMQAALH